MNPVLVLAVLLVALVGCKPQDSTTPTASQSPATSSPDGQQPVMKTTEPVVIAESNDMDAVLAQLSAELRSYVGSTRSAPKDFQDFVTRAHVQVPAPPAGKQYAIEHGMVVLVNQ